ncbi:MAG: exosortase system-associated protein, TIGR04073 family [Candidatus Omnitrophota bacterium]|jgi:putative exosortase-associated protein (TIGR04073 family)
MNTKILVAIILIALFITGVSYAADVKTNITPGNKSAIAGASATTPSLAHKPGMKAERGVKNILFGWTDIPKSIIQVTRDSKNPIWGLTAGTLKGVGKAFPRTVSGIADVVSFPMGDYDKMPVHPDELKTQIQ